MNQINLLRQALKPHLKWHGARLSFLALFLIALLRVKTVNLAEIATGFRTHAQIESSYKRLQGNSNSDERMDLLDRFRQIFPDAKIAYLSGDREFVGKQWLTYLLIEPVISFRLRIKKSDRISDGKKQLRASIVFANLKPGQTQILSGRRWVWGRQVYISALRLDNGELLIIISPDSSSTVVSDYGKRWGIETLFGMFKTRGFCLESTHFNDSERLSKLIALMSLALCWAVKTGEWLHQLNPIKVKKHGRLTPKNSGDINTLSPNVEMFYVLNFCFRTQAAKKLFKLIVYSLWF